MSGAKGRVVAYVNSYAYAHGTANDVRATGVVAALSNLGAHVEVMASPGAFSSRWERIATRAPRLGSRLRSLLIGGSVPAWLDGLEHPPAIVWLYGVDLRFSARVLRWGRRHRVPVVCEIVDWYELGDLTGLPAKLVLGLTNTVAMPWVRRRAAGVVVASRSLGDYFASRARVVQRIPAVMPDAPVQLDADERPVEAPLRVGYIGAPGKRDLATLANLRHVAEGWTGRDLEIHVAGPAAPSEPWRPTEGVEVRFHGRLSRSEALDLVARCDGTVLQRPGDRRFARAGFPSKVAESMTAGTPPVANLTSDLELYLVEGENSIVLNDDSATALLQGLERLAQTPIDRGRVRTCGSAAFSVATAERRIADLFRSMGLT